MRLAVIGAGINGIMCAWALLEDGHDVVLFERDEPVGATSRASTKLLHGGLRYLEHGDFRLVREGLRARGWWLEQAPQLTGAIDIAVPLYRRTTRRRLKLKAGLILYDLLAGRHRLGKHRWVEAESLRRQLPQLRDEGLRGAYLFRDGQMDDLRLGRWALQQVLEMGARLRSDVPVERIGLDGLVTTPQGSEQFDGVINACGPWSAALLERSGIAARHQLELVRGSHLQVARQHRIGALLESPDDGRPCFVLPYANGILIGTTEVRQRLDQPVECSDDERAYLLRVYNAYFEPHLDASEVISTFAGLRPLVAAATKDASALTRESVIECHGRTLTVFGGKWTTSRELGRQVATAIGNCRAARQ